MPRYETTLLISSNESSFVIRVANDGFYDLFSFKTENNMKLIDYVGRVDIPKSREMIKVLSDSGKCVRP